MYILQSLTSIGRRSNNRYLRSHSRWARSVRDGFPRTVTNCFRELCYREMNVPVGLSVRQTVEIEVSPGHGGCPKKAHEWVDKQLTALRTRVAVIVPEVPFDPEKLALLLTEDKRANPTNYAMLVLSEAAAIEPEKAAKYVTSSQALDKISRDESARRR